MITATRTLATVLFVGVALAVAPAAEACFVCDCRCNEGDWPCETGCDNSPIDFPRYGCYLWDDLENFGEYGGDLCWELPSGEFCYIPTMNCGDDDPPGGWPPPPPWHVPPLDWDCYYTSCVPTNNVLLFDPQYIGDPQGMQSLVIDKTAPADIRRRIASWLSIPEPDVKLRQYGALVGASGGLQGDYGFRTEGYDILPRRTYDPDTNHSRLEVCTAGPDYDPIKVADVPDVSPGQTVLTLTSLGDDWVVVAITEYLDTEQEFRTDRPARQAALYQAAAAILEAPVFTLQPVGPVALPCE